MWRQRKLRIPIWYYRKTKFYNILLDEMLYGARLGWLVLSLWDAKYRKVPYGNNKTVEIDDIGETLNG